MKRLLLFLVLLFVYPVEAQVYPAPPGTGTAANIPHTCRMPQSYFATDTTTLYVCISNTAAYPSNWSTVGGGLATNASVSPSQAYYFSPNCGSLPNCTQIHDDALWLTDCTTNSTTLVTCPDAVFRASDVGKSAYVTTLGTANGLSYNALLDCPVTTIATFNSSTSISLTAACTGASLTGNAALFYGTPDGSAIATAMNAHCANFTFPGVSNSAEPGIAKIWADVGFGNAIPAGCNTPYSSMTGATPNASSVVFLIPANFDWTTCTGATGSGATNVCFGSKMIGMNYMSFFGGGLNGAGSCPNAANGTTVVAPYGPVNQNYGLNLNGICPGTSLMKGYQLDGYDETVTWGGAVNVGQYSCVVNSLGVSQFYNDCENNGTSVAGNACTGGIGLCLGLYVTANGQLQDYGSIRLQKVFSQGYIQTRGSTLCGLVETNDAGGYAIIASGAAARWLSDGDYINQPTSCSSFGGGVNLSTGAQGYVKNTQFNGTATFTDVNLAATGSNYFFDQCGNTFPGSPAALIAIGSASSAVIGDCSITGSPLVTGNLVLSANWGSTRATSAWLGFTSPVTFTITNGAATTGAAPTIAYTFPTQYLQAPLWCTASQVGGTNATGTFTSSALTATGVTFTYSLTPTVNLTEVIQVTCVSQK